MKKLLNHLLPATTTIAKPANAGTLIFTTTDLWHIHRLGKIRPQRRFL
jgi:hypothetical protein